MSEEVRQMYCAVRKEWVAASPEEIVRQKLVHHMLDNLGFPIGYMALERGLRQMPHLALQEKKIPNRRADIVCFGKGIHPTFSLYPLLLIECKAVALTSAVINQVTGYNHFLAAHFISIVNEREIRTGWYDSIQKKYTFVSFLPTYVELMQFVLRSS